MLTLQKTLDSSWDVARQSLRDDLVTIETVLNRKWGQTFGNANILPVGAGGTGLGSYTIGDLLYASAATTLSKLPVGASGKILRSNGTLPVWSTFTIPDTYAQGDLLYASAANALTALAKNVTATRYLSNTGGSNNPAWAQVDVSTGVTGMAALTKVDDTNVTITLGGSPASALIRAVSLTMGWTGTLSAARGGTGVGTLGDLTRTNDTNVTVTLGGTPTGSLIQAVSLTLGWTGTLAVARGGIGIGTLASNGVLYGNGTSAVQALAVNATATRKFLLQLSSGAPSWDTITAADVPGSALTRTNDTNVTVTLGGTPSTALLAAASLTLGWTGQLSVARGGTGAATLTGVLFGNGTSAVTAVALPADATKYLDGTGAFSVPAGGGGTTAYAAGTTSVTTGHFLVMSNHLILTSTQRMTLAGTARLALIT